MLIAATTAFTLLAVGGKRGLRAAAAVAGGAAVVVAPLLLIWRPSVLAREWFIVPLTNNYLGQTGGSRSLAVACGLIAVAMAVSALRLRDRLLAAIAVVQGTLVASMLHNTELHHVAVNSFPLMVFVPLALQRRAARKRAGEPSPAAAPAKQPPATAMLAIVRRHVRGVDGDAGGPSALEAEHALLRFRPARSPQPVPPAARRRRARDLRRSVHARSLLRAGQEEPVLRLRDGGLRRRLPPAAARASRSDQARDRVLRPTR